jgi:hypothetical protein
MKPIKVFLIVEPGRMIAETIRQILSKDGFDVWPKDVEQPIAALEVDVCILIRPCRAIEFVYAGFLRGAGQKMWLFDEHSKQDLNKYTFFDKSFSMCEDVIFACLQLRDELESAKMGSNK